MSDDATRSHAATPEPDGSWVPDVDSGNCFHPTIRDLQCNCGDGPCRNGDAHYGREPGNATPDRAATLEEAADRFEELLESWGYNRLEIARLTRTVIYGE